MPIEWITRESRTRSWHRINVNGQEIRVAGFRPGQGKGLWVCLTITPAVMARMRWGAGELVSVGYDGTDNLYLKDDPGGFRLTPVGSARKDIRESRGKPVLSQIRFAWREGMSTKIEDGYSKVSDQITVEHQTGILTLGVV